VFLVNSRHPLACAPRPWLPRTEARFSRGYAGNLPSSFDTVRSTAWVCSTSPPVSVSGTVLLRGLFPGELKPHGQSSKAAPPFAPVTTRGPGNVDPVPIAYAFRPRLRGRLTLRGLALRRNPWTSGGSVSHAAWRYSCQHSHSPYLQHGSRRTFNGLGDAPLPVQRPEIRGQRSERSDRSRPASIRAISWYSSLQRRQVGSSI
jgi:hypothetical protein